MSLMSSPFGVVLVCWRVGGIKTARRSLVDIPMVGFYKVYTNEAEGVHTAMISHCSLAVDWAKFSSSLYEVLHQE